MKPFTITCTTCQQPLEVEDESAIGEIMICQKCGSMVMVEPPGNEQPPPAAAPPIEPPGVKTANAPRETSSPCVPLPAAQSPQMADAEPYDEELDKETVVDPFPASEFADVPLSASPMKPTPAKPGRSTDPAESRVQALPGQTVGGDEKKSGEGEPFEDRQPHGPEQADLGDEAGDGESADRPGTVPVLPTDAWTSQAARQRKQMVLIGGAAITGVVLAIAVLGFFASRAARQTAADLKTPEGDGPLASGASATGVSTKRPLPSDVEGGTQQEAANDTDSKPEPDTPEEPEETEADAAQSGGVEGPAAEDLDHEVTLEEPSAIESDVPDAPPDTATQTGETVPPETAPSETASPKVSPGEPDGPAETQQPDHAPDEGTLAAAMDVFAPFIETESPPAPMDQPDTLAPVFDMEVVEDEPTVARPAPRAVDVPARLADRIPKIEFADVPLIHFLRFVSEFSTIPITLDPDALALLNKTPKTAVGVRADDVAIQTLLETALKPLGLTAIQQAGQLVVTRGLHPPDKLRTVQHPADDLAASQEDLQELAGRIVEMIEPDTWDVYGGSGAIRVELPVLVIQQQDTILFRVLVFLDRLRAARKLPPRSNFNSVLFRLTPRFQLSDAQLVKPLTVNYVQPMRFERILDAIANESGVAILVDWQALAQAGWNPDAETTLTALNEPLSTTMDKLLRPMGLTYRVVDDNCLQVTTKTAMLSRLDIEFYPIDKLSPGAEQDEAWLKALVQKLGEESIRELRGTLYIDPVSRRLVAALPQQHQRQLAEFLNSSGGDLLTQPKQQDNRL